jgi:CRISPR-associated protein Cmr4
VSSNPPAYILFLRALTPLHVGAGRGASVHVELPVQRDEFGFPTIWASSLKGALRANFDRGSKCDKNIIFGPEPASPEVSDYSSAASFTDSRLILIPGRLLKGVWAFITSPHMLEQFKVLLEVRGEKVDMLSVPSVSDDEALVSKPELILTGSDGKKYIVVNEAKLEKAREDKAVAESLSKVLPDKIASMVKDKGVIVVPDTISRDIINRSMVIQYRVRLDPNTKTVEQGPWSEEYTPSNTVMASLVVCREPRRRGSGGGACASATDVCSDLVGYFTSTRSTIYVGGKETIGKGLIELYFR